MAGMNSGIRAVSVVYDHAVEKGYIAEKEGTLFLDDVQEGLVKDGLGANTELAVFLVALKSVSPAPALIEIGAMLHRL